MQRTDKVTVALVKKKNETDTRAKSRLIEYFRSLQASPSLLVRERQDKHTHNVRAQSNHEGETTAHCMVL